MRNCERCGRLYRPSNYKQKFCCSSCRNCASSSRRMASKDLNRLLRGTGYYASEAGRKEVELGLHDKELEANGFTRDEWLAGKRKVITHMKLDDKNSFASLFEAHLKELQNNTKNE